MTLFVLDEFEMAILQSEKPVWRRKAEAKHCTHIMEDLELLNVHNKKRRKQYAMAKWLNKKRMVRNHRRKLLKPSDSIEELRSRIRRPRTG